MQFVTNHLISFLISGTFALLWIAIPFFSFFIPYLQSIKAIDPNSIIGLFFLFILTYSLGTAINSMANKLFGVEDKKIRENVFKKFHIADTITDTNSITETYHLFRYKLYLQSSNVYEYLSFHRETIRILRATAMNMLMISLSVLTLTDYSYAMSALMLLLLILMQYEYEKLFITMWTAIAAFLSIIIFHTAIFKTLTLPFVLSILALFFALLCYWEWKKQQKDFYETIIRFYKAANLD